MDANDWMWPTDEEQRLFAAKQNNDIGAYCAVLAALDVYVACRLDDAEAYLAGERGGSTRYVTSKEADGKTYLAVYTRGMIPPERPHGVYFDHTMWTGFAENLAAQNPDWILTVNRGTALEAFLSVGEVAKWLTANRQAVGSWSSLRSTLRTLRSEPVEGDLARALACGAHLSVMNGLPWNTMGADRLDFQNDRVTLRDWWGIETVEDWRGVADSLLDTEMLGTVDLVLALRRDGGGGAAPSPDPDVLIQGVKAWCQNRDMPAASVAELMEVAGLVGACEEWLRRDGILPYGGVVQTQAAWDLGRAVNMARWGLTGGLCDRETAERIVRRAGALCLQLYPTWTELSAGYIVGRVVMMGRQGSPEQTYQESLRIHGVLLGTPSSPWRTLPMH